MSREMLVMFGLMLLMLQMISCVDQTCRFNQTEICYAALGHKLSLQMVPDSQHYDATLKHHKTGDTTVDPTCKIKNDTIKRCDLYVIRSDVLITNGAVIINGVIREDSGKYTLDLYDSTGSVTYKELHVNVEVPAVGLIVLGCVTVILVVLFITVYHIYKRKKHHKSTAEHQTERKEMKDEELQYGEVTFTPDMSNIQQQQRRCKEQDELSIPRFIEQPW
ncbi:uncharacterized protein si:zfos-741a10.3 [Triplophysa rosa]|uniref:uncharacterized protein si:zfos-741a10.3 n=1 Tax=Triplophysa rosa TaxID=992332 RepID=UPI002546338B|nr:uncharacterized protein si:zfos-741a10.3 [Triplophysa rosa]XP_057183116.1 uncharacterized protein si:zfos-741a10.3 [Triplophysa rosa]